MSGAKIDDSAAGDVRRWDVTWADVEQAQLETMLNATPAQRLAWLEEAMRLALVSGALEARRESSIAPHRHASSGLPRRGPAANRSSGRD